MSKDAEKLENIIRASIDTDYGDKLLPTEEEFLSCAEKMREAMQTIAPVTDDEYKAVLEDLRKSIKVVMDVGVYIDNPDNGHKPWLAAKKSSLYFFYWERYREYLQREEHWNPGMLTNLGKISDDILDLCGNPEEESFGIKGLILGDVQSGKTATYTAVCNKAADAGYRVIIILAGMQETLRKQTQERLDRECAGRRSEYYLDPNADEGIKNQLVGVGRIRDDKKIVAFTSVTTDFSSRVLASNNLGIENVNCPVILVVKKNKKILNNLIRWLKNNNTFNSYGKIGLPLMLIDDEADNASVNTKDKDSDPTAINSCIRQLLKLFSRKTYLGITATPFANIFIDPEKDDELFPSDFLYALTPPTDYIGPDDVFGDDGKYTDIVEEINTDEFEMCLPEKHRKGFDVSDLPEDLYEAARYFILASAVMDYRGNTTKHRSMMVHISLYTDVQEKITDRLYSWLEQVVSDLGNYSKLPSDQAEKIPSIKSLHEVWIKYRLEDRAGIAWDRMLSDYLYKAAAPIQVRSVNMKNGAKSLNYHDYKDTGLRIIAVGGNSLSRGLTLEGLCVSYFHRGTKMYDTLLQMGRWFGYRRNYDDLIKIWMTSETKDWYGQITDSSAEFRDEIRRMRDLNMTPRDFGLRIRQDPGALIITARNKMRTAAQLEIPVTVSGHLLETPRLMSDLSTLRNNETVLMNFINALSYEGKRLHDDERTKTHYFWQGVNSDLVAQLLLDFKTNPWHLNFNGTGLSDYIRKNSGDWPDGWDVVLINTGTGTQYPDGIRCGNELLYVEHTESRKIEISDDALRISGTKACVGQGGCASIGLTKAQIDEAATEFRKTSDKKNIPNRAYMIKNRPPILMLHIIEAIYKDSPRASEYPQFLFALGVGFPKDDNPTKTAIYKINIVAQQTSIFDDYDDYDDYDEEDA